MVLDGDDGTLFSSEDSSKQNLEECMIMAKFKAAFDAEVRHCNKMCWDLCVDKAGAKLDDKQATCLSNCVDRFVDVSRFIRQRFVQSLQSNGYNNQY